jgi:hypothetical protein
MSATARAHPSSYTLVDHASPVTANTAAAFQGNVRVKFFAP